MEQEIKNIVINMNSAYFPYSLVMLKSVFENNTDSFFCVYLLYSDMRQWELDYLDAFIRSISGNFVPVKVDNRVFQDFPIEKRWTVETYYRLLIPQLLPADVSSVVYLDIDLVVDDRISELFQLDLNGYYLAACEDLHEALNVQKLNRIWNRPSAAKYFNAGVMVLNLTEIRQKIQFADYVKVIHAMQNDLPYMDQDILNCLLGVKVKWLQPKYNNVVGIPTGKERPGIIYHYGTPQKPWNNSRKTAFQDIWQKYRSLVIDYENILEKVIEERNRDV